MSISISLCISMHILSLYLYVPIAICLSVSIYHPDRHRIPHGPRLLLSERAPTRRRPKSFRKPKDLQAPSHVPLLQGWRTRSHPGRGLGPWGRIHAGEVLVSGCFSGEGVGGSGGGGGVFSVVLVLSLVKLLLLVSFSLFLYHHHHHHHEHDPWPFSPSPLSSLTQINKVTRSLSSLASRSRGPPEGLAIKTRIHSWICK